MASGSRYPDPTCLVGRAGSGREIHPGFRSLPPAPLPGFLLPWLRRPTTMEAS